MGSKRASASAWASPQLWWRIAIVVVCAVGLMGGESRLTFYTTQSNAIVAAYFAVAVHRMVRDATTIPPAPRLRGAVTHWIAVTGLVSHVLLTAGANPLPGLADPDPSLALQNQTVFLLHYVVPVMVLLDWVVFGPHGLVRWRDGLLWMLYPLAYFGLTLVRAAALPLVPDRFPYPFLDVETLGAGVVWQLASVIAFIAAIAAAVIALDRLAAFVARRLTARRRTPDAAAARA